MGLVASDKELHGGEGERSRGIGHGSDERRNGKRRSGDGDDERWRTSEESMCENGGVYVCECVDNSNYFVSYFSMNYLFLRPGKWSKDQRERGQKRLVLHRSK